ncbi:type II secretion system protein [bacterium]|nr:type II secretion system protein [bacterium]
MTRDQGFTLIEMVVVIAIIALLAGVLTPLIFNVLDDANEAATREEMANMRTAILRYYEHMNQWPPTWVSDGRNVYTGLKVLAATMTEHGYLYPSDSSGKAYSHVRHFEPYDPAYGVGWNGPYIAESGDDTGYYYDAWDHKYSFVAAPDYYAVRLDVGEGASLPGTGSPRYDEGYEAVPVQPARVFIASPGRDGAHTDVMSSGRPSVKTNDDLYPENIDDIVLMIGGTDYQKDWWFPLAGTDPYK